MVGYDQTGTRFDNANRLESRAPSSSYNRKSTVEDVDDEVVKVPKKKTWNPDEDDSAIDAGDYEKTPKAKKKGREDDEKMIEADEEQKSAKKKPKKGREKRAYETQEDSEEEQISAYNVSVKAATTCNTIFRYTRTTWS